MRGGTAGGVIFLADSVGVEIDPRKPPVFKVKISRPRRRTLDSVLLQSTKESDSPNGGGGHNQEESPYRLAMRRRC